MFLTLLSLLAFAQTAKGPAFTCTDVDGAQYRIWLTPEKKAIQIVQKGTTTEIRLADANFGRVVTGPGKPLYFNGWNPKGEDILENLEMGHEFVSHYTTTKNSSQVKVSLVVDHRERIGLKCRSSKNAVTVIPLEKEQPLAKRYGEQIREFARTRSVDGKLAVGVLGIVSMLQRYSHTEGFKNSAARVQFIEEIGGALKSIHPDSVAEIGKRLPLSLHEFWKAALTQTQYAYFPEVQRYTGWVAEGGANKESVSIAAGFAVFTSSGAFKEKDIRDFFIKEVTPVLKGLDEVEATEIKESLKGLALTFFTDLWTKAAGKRTLADFPDIQSMATNLALAASAEEFEPERIAEILSGFLKSNMAMDEDARKLFVDSARPQLQALNPRQREDVTGWLNPADKEFFLDLLK